jgi:hypothetical protein
MSGRAVLHRLHNASVHNQRRPLLVPQLPHEIRQEQVQTQGHPQDRLRLVAVDSDESALEPHVLQGETSSFIHALDPLTFSVIGTGPGLLDNRRHVSDSRSALQIHRIHHLFLHPPAGNAGDLRPHRATPRPAKTKPGHSRLVQQLDGRTHHHRAR